MSSVYIPLLCPTFCVMITVLFDYAYVGIHPSPPLGTLHLFCPEALLCLLQGSACSLVKVLIPCVSPVCSSEALGRLEREVIVTACTLFVIT